MEPRETPGAFFIDAARNWPGLMLRSRAARRGVSKHARGPQKFAARISPVPWSARGRHDTTSRKYFLSAWLFPV